MLCYIVVIKSEKLERIPEGVEEQSGVADERAKLTKHGVFYDD